MNIENKMKYNDKISISIVVPVYNDIDSMSRFLKIISNIKVAAESTFEYEVIISDASTNNEIEEMIKNYKSNFYIKYIRSNKGRGIQLNKGFEASKGDCILFLHVDSVVKPDVLEYVKDAYLSGIEFGCLKISFDSNTLLMNLCGLMSRSRAKYRKIAFGDQGMFFSRNMFIRLKGFKNIPIMEDYDISIRSKKFTTLKQIDSEIITSSRRFYPNGNKSFVNAIKMMIKMQYLQYRFRKGDDPKYLSKLYNKI